MLSLAYEAEVSTTTGTVRFDKDGRHASGKKREAGSRIAVRLPMTRAEYEEVCLAAWRLLPRDGVVLTFNGGVIPSGKPIETVEAELGFSYAQVDRLLLLLVEDFLARFDRTPAAATCARCGARLRLVPLLAHGPAPPTLH